MPHGLGRALVIAASATLCTSVASCSNDSKADDSGVSPRSETDASRAEDGGGPVDPGADTLDAAAHEDASDSSVGDAPSDASAVSDKVREAGTKPDAYVPVDAEPPAPFECESPLPLADADALLDVLDELPWQSVSTSTAAALQLSPDYVLGSDVRLRVDQLPVPPELKCEDTDAGGRAWCSEWTWFRAGTFPYESARPVVAGVSCVEPGNSLGDGWGTCMEVIITAGTVLRLRATIQDLHPDVPEAFIEFERPCAEPCDVQEKRCEATETCLPSSEHCARCEGREQRECACAGRVEGDECSFASSPDYDVVDVCSSGLCGGS